MSQSKFHQIRITKSMFSMFKFQYKNEKKQKKGKNVSGLQNGTIRGLQIGAVFRNYKSGTEEMQVGAALGISNWGKKITNWGKKITNRSRDFKLGQKDFKLWHTLQTGARRVSNRAEITNGCRTRSLFRKVVETSSQEDLNVIKNTLPNKLKSPENLNK